MALAERIAQAKVRRYHRQQHGLHRGLGRGIAGPTTEEARQERTSNRPALFFVFLVIAMISFLTGRRGVM